MRYRVPQNIDMEDKIIGPLTMAQFVFVLMGGMLVYLDFVTLGVSFPFLFWVTAIPIGLITLAFGFGKVQDQPFPKFLASVLLYLTRPKSRVWQKDPAMNHLTVVKKNPTTPEEASIPGDTLDRGDVSSLASVLDTQAGNQPSVKSKGLGVRGEDASRLTVHTPPDEAAPYHSAPPLASMEPSSPVKLEGKVLDSGIGSDASRLTPHDLPDPKDHQ